MSSQYTHSKDCPDRKDAAADRKAHAASATRRQAHHQLLAHAAWFDWYAPPLPTHARAAGQRPSGTLGT